MDRPIHPRSPLRGLLSHDNSYTFVISEEFLFPVPAFLNFLEGLRTAGAPQLAEEMSRTVFTLTGADQQQGWGKNTALQVQEKIFPSMFSSSSGEDEQGHRSTDGGEYDEDPANAATVDKHLAGGEDPPDAGSGISLDLPNTTRDNYLDGTMLGARGLLAALPDFRTFIFNRDSMEFLRTGGNLASVVKVTNKRPPPLGAGPYYATDAWEPAFSGSEKNLKKCAFPLVRVCHTRAVLGTAGSGTLVWSLELYNATGIFENMLENVRFPVEGKIFCHRAV